MSAEVAVRVQNVSKTYRIYDKPEHRLVQMATLGRVRRFKEFSALKDVSLEVRRGETVGIVGRNGCGKSTLLQIICGTLQPSGGHVEVNGRVAALLELGAGFNGEFTGRENVYMNGAILGFSREEMDARFDQIAAFAGIGDFIERPVKTYSSGMFVRLAFAVATAVEPDILIVDEALAVGDEAFQRKCFARIEAIKERGGTILFVSHSAQSVVQLCDRAVLLDAGEKLLDAKPKTIVTQYQRLLHAPTDLGNTIRNEIRVAESRDSPELEQSGFEITSQNCENEPDHFDPHLQEIDTLVYPKNGGSIQNVRILNESGQSVNLLRPFRTYRYTYHVHFTQDFSRVVFAMLVKTVSGLELAGQLSHTPGTGLSVVSGDVVEISMPFSTHLLPGSYFANAGVFTNDDVDGFRQIHRLVDAIAFKIISNSSELSRMGHFDFVPKNEAVTYSKVA